MRRWLVAMISVAVVSVLVPTWATLWLVLGAVQDIEERRENDEAARAEEMQVVRDEVECVLRLMLVPPERREGFTVSRILDSCPGALPERDGDGGDEFETGGHPGSRQPWESVP